MTKELRKVIKSKLDEITNSGSTYYMRADKGAIFPHKVFSLTNVDLTNAPRHDFIITVDVWTKNANSADEIADKIVKSFESDNAPNDYILPTFYAATLRTVEDENKDIERREIKLQCQVYEREREENA